MSKIAASLSFQATSQTGNKIIISMDRLRFIQNFNKLSTPSNPDRHWDSSSIVEGTFKHFSLLKWLSEWDLDSMEMPGKQTHDGEATAALNAVPWNRNCLKSTKYSWFQFSSPFVVWKSGFDSRRMCNKRSSPLCQLTQLLANCWVLNQLSHVNISCSHHPPGFYQGTASSGVGGRLLCHAFLNQTHDAEVWRPQSQSKKS